MAVLKNVALVLAASVVLQACISGSTSQTTATPASPEEAAQYNLQLGIGYLRQGNLQAAREKLERAVEQQPGLATAHAALGVVFERLEDPAGAERHFRRAVELDGRDPDNLNALAVFTCNQKQKPEEALRLFDRAIAIPLSVRSANRTMLYTNAGTCAKRVDLGRSEAYLRGALGQDPRFPDALLQLADVMLEQGNPLQARGFLERYLDGSPATPGSLLLGFRIEQALQDPGAARDYRDRLQREFPGSPETRALLDQSGRTG